MDIAHDVNLQNHTHHIYSGLSPEEVWTGPKSSHSAIQDSHPWRCPAHVLEPKLQDGNNFPKWMLGSKIAQYLGASPIRCSTVGLVRNLKTGNTRPQFHLLFDDYFETVHAGEDQ